MNKNHLFASYKAIGFVVNEIPISVGIYRRKKEPYVVTCVGRAFHTYNVKKLAIVNISDSLPNSITCLKTDSKFVYAACKNDIYIFFQWRKVWKILKGHKDDVKLILPFADHLISIDETNNLKVWTVEDGELYSEMYFDGDTFDVTCIEHPLEYVNKVLMGSRQGTMRLVNLSQNQVIYSYQGWASPVTAIKQSQAVNVVAVGLKDGRIILHDLKFDESLMVFKQDWGPVTSISFRSDVDYIMVVGSEMGHIGIWNLKKKKLITQVNEAHDGPITGLHCIETTPTMLTSSNDNCLKMWIFDETEGGARLLSQRSGHSKPPVKIRFHGTSGNVILSAGLDSTLRNFSTVHDSYNRSLGRASYNKRLSKKVNLKQDTLVMPPIVDFVSEISRQSDWDGLLCVHSNERLATTWSFNKCCMGKYKFSAKDRSRVVGSSGDSYGDDDGDDGRGDDEGSRGAVAKCVCLTACGNFGLVGFSSGRVSVFNMQSGLHRGCYGDEGSKRLAHGSCITGVFVDDLNSTTITMAREVGVKFWTFKGKKFVQSLTLHATPRMAIMNRNNNLLAISLNDFSLVLLDAESKKVVRKISGHKNDVTDMTFARGGRWLVTACMDSCIRVFDLYSSVLLDIFQLHTPATSITMSPTDELLATTHVDDLGIYLWYNKSLYAPASLTATNSLDVSEGKVGDVVELLELPRTKCDDDDYDDGDDNDKQRTESSTTTKLGQLGKMVTLSNLSELRWLSLSRYDLIKEKNAPREALKVPKQAPFFLPTKQGLEFEFEKPEELKDESKIKNKKVYFLLYTLHYNFEGNLQKFSCTDDDVRDYFLTLYPSSIDAELRCMSLDFGGRAEILVCFLLFLRSWLSSNNQFEICNAIFDRFVEV
ncbi:hypothetical protein HELRODRAFT_104619, partial [Helobdella robusta]|uniref:Small-subunit processome Utp21 domain-containing protein n=1 Tax=Helobdella robusta TaxID=6412 RepID=T1EDM6_HELRO